MSSRTFTPSKRFARSPTSEVLPTPIGPSTAMWWRPSSPTDLFMAGPSLPANREPEIGDSGEPDRDGNKAVRREERRVEPREIARFHDRVLVRERGRRERDSRPENDSSRNGGHEEREKNERRDVKNGRNEKRSSCSKARREGNGVPTAGRTPRPEERRARRNRPSRRGLPRRGAPAPPRAVPGPRSRRREGRSRGRDRARDGTPP